MKSKFNIQLLNRILLFLLLFGFLHISYANQKLTVLLDWFANPGHAPLFVAQEMGFFHEQGLDVELIGPADPAAPPKLVAANQADIAITYEPHFIQQVDQGLPLIRIATLTNKPLDCLIVLQESTIKKIADLKGKRIGYSSGDINSVALKTILAKAGLTLLDVKLINVNYNLTQSLLSQKVDAVIGVMRTFEVIQLKLAKHPARIFYPEQYGVPTYDELILVVNKKHVGDPRFPKFLIALQKANRYLQAHPQEMWLLFTKNHPELNDELNKLVWFESLPYFATQPSAFNAEEWLFFAAYLQKNALIKQVLPINHYAVDLFKE